MSTTLKLFNPDDFSSLHEQIMAEHLKGKKIVLVNIGTDKLIGDCFGPLFGQMIKENNYQNIISYGDLDNPIHAQNLTQKFNFINEKHKDDFIIGVDASLLKKEGDPFYKNIFYGLEPVKPGASKYDEEALPYVGHMKILYAIDSVSYFEFLNVNYRIGEIYNKCRQLVKLFDSIDIAINNSIYIERNSIK